MKNIVFVLALVMFTAPAMTMAKPARQPAGIKVLNQWSGAWESRVVIKPAVWTPTTVKRTEAKDAAWLLNGHFQQVTTRSHEHESREIQRYNEEGREYEKWIFDSYGHVSYWTGTWDEATSTMIWQMQLSPLKGLIVDRFVGTDKYTTTVIIKDVKGNVLLDVWAEHVRVEKQPQ